MEPTIVSNYEHRVSSHRNICFLDLCSYLQAYLSTNEIEDKISSHVPCGRVTCTHETVIYPSDVYFSLNHLSFEVTVIDFCVE